MKAWSARATVAALAALAAAEVSAVRHVGFETDAFNKTYPASNRGTFVFSPASFEVDCVLVAESLDVIPKADISAMMGVVIDFPSAYIPVLEGLGNRTNGFSFISARGFCVPDIRKASVATRLALQRDYGAEVMRLMPKEGAEAWFKTMLDGEMGDFSISPSVSASDRFSFYDLVSFSVAWEEPFPPENAVQLPFRPDGATNDVEVAAISDVRVADVWETKEYSLLMLPLKGGSTFFGFLPKEGFSISDARVDITSLEIDGLLSLVGAGPERGVRRGPCRIVIPRLEISSRTDFTGAFRYFRIPTAGLHSVAGEASGREFVQFAKFSLANCAPGEKPVPREDGDGASPAQAEARNMVFNRPFVFFVYHSGTATIPVAGQFAGP